MVVERIAVQKHHSPMQSEQPSGPPTDLWRQKVAWKYTYDFYHSTDTGGEQCQGDARLCKANDVSPWQTYTAIRVLSAREG